MPIKTFEIELDQPIQTFYFEEGFDFYRALVRSKKHPIGWIYFDCQNKNNCVSAEEIRDMIDEQLDYTIVHQALLCSFNQTADVDTDEGISVIVCTRNRTTQLTHCIQSLLKLDYVEYEIIIVDNAPDNDETYQLVRSLPVRYVREDRPGLDWARNRGIAEAKYPIVAFTDDDVRVDPYWLKAIAKIFSDEEIMGASGYVAPAELDSYAQRLFELKYGGMGHGYERRFIKKEGLSEKQLLWASGFGIGANMAFRRQIFEKIGKFDTALDVGTPSQGAGDIELFHRLIHCGYLFVYEPSMLIWHYHRREYAGLRKQIYNNGRSFGCFLINCFNKKTVNRFTIIRFFIIDWLLFWILKNLYTRRIPRKLSIIELEGMLTSPIAYWKTQKWNDKILKEFASTSQSYNLEPELVYDIVPREK